MGLNIDIELENGQWRGQLTFTACESARYYQPEVLRFLATEMKKNNTLTITTMNFNDARIKMNGYWNHTQINRFSRFHDKMFVNHNKN